MTNLRLFTLTLAAVAALTVNSFAQSINATSTNTLSPSTNAPSTKGVARPSVKQGDVASTNAMFGKIKTTDAPYKSALDAHALDDALKLVDKDGAFKGTVAKVFEPRNMAIINFDANYRKSLTAVVQAANFKQFPALTNLVGKEVVVTGKFADYQGRAQIIVTNSLQIKVVEVETK